MKTDVQIQNDVMAQIKWEPLLNAAEIGVAVKNGVVTLSGHVDKYPQKKAAEKAAKKVKGVKVVAEEIIVGISSADKRSDTEIAEAIVNALKWNTAVSEDKVKIQIEDGFVTLSGEVDLPYEKTSAAAAIEPIKGVKMVLNIITIKPKPLSGDVLQKIKDAFTRHATIDAGKIRIDIDGNKVTLKGTVRSCVESEDAESAAWSASGVTAVENKLEIKEEEFAYN